MVSNTSAVLDVENDLPQVGWIQYIYVVNGNQIAFHDELTRVKRCQRTQQDCPLILEVVEKFPCLASSCQTGMTFLHVCILIEILFRSDENFRQ